MADFSYFFRRVDGSWVTHGSPRASKVACSGRQDALATRERLESDHGQKLEIWRNLNEPFTCNEWSPERVA